jgi:cytochrome c oxidase cbb3-type subunit 2
MSGGYRVTAALVVAKDQSGRLHHTYCGDWISWLNDEQRGHFLRLGLVEEIDNESADVVELHPEPAEAAVAVKPDRIGECVEALDRLEIPSDAGAPTARTALRDAGFRWGNGVIAAAVRQRKLRAS